MTEKRIAELQQVLYCAEQALRNVPAPPTGSVPLADRVFRALDSPSGTGSAGHETDVPDPPPACEFLPVAISAACRMGGPVAELASAVEGLASHLTWERRPGAEQESASFFDGHANAVLVGPRGLESRLDVLVGLSLMAPGVRYPDHQHPPEEFYVVLSGGQWRQGDGPWHEPGPGGVVYNPPGILHAMRSGDAPLLALWFLWTG